MEKIATPSGGSGLEYLSLQALDNDATGYTVKRATTAGDPYEIIASNLAAASYSDTNVTHGITYYYIVTALSANGEGAPSNEVTAALLAPEPTVKPATLIPTIEPTATPIPEAATGDKAILTIYLTNGTEKEYDLSMTEVNAFINWYDRKDAGVGPAKYAFIKDWNQGPFSRRTEL